MAKPKIKYITPEELSSVRMVSGNENKFSVIIDPEMVLKKKRWVGIGWVDEGEATADDLRKYPVVKRKEINASK